MEAKAEIISPKRVDQEIKRIESLINARNVARKAKNFKESDRIRDELTEMGVELEDKADGTTKWKVKV
jgi:cysteinyl-tRNA synthetase